MHKPIPIFYNALLLTGVNLLLRMAGTGFQVYISRKMGAAGVGLLQLTMSVGGFALVTGMAGIRTATMYLTAGALGRKRPGQVLWILSGCVRYSLLCSGIISLLLFTFSGTIATGWIRNPETANALRLFALFLPISCLCGVMTGYFTAACRIRTLAAIEVAEQLLSMAVTMAALNFWADSHPGRACQSVILGSGFGGCLTLLCLILLRLREDSPKTTAIPVYKDLLDTALPLGAADVLKSGINTVENLMVPRRLALNGGITNPLAAFGVLSGMVFPVVMFPACILFALCELLIPELSRCHASGSRIRIGYLVRTALGISLLYGSFFAGGIWLLAEPLSRALYGTAEAVEQMRLYSLLIPMLYCDAIVDAMTKGLGQQKLCVRYNIFTSTLDVIFLFLLLPKYAMIGYFLSFLVTHLLNFCLSLRRLLIISGQSLPLRFAAFTLGALVAAMTGAGTFSQPIVRLIAYAALLFSLWTLLGVLSAKTLYWLRGLIFRTKEPCA